MNRRNLIGAITILIAAFSFVACNKEDSTTTPATTTPTTTTPTDTTGIPDVYKKIYNKTDMYKDGDYLVIKCTSLPDHKSPYYQGTQWATALYEAYNGTNSSWNQNPNKITQANLTFRIPLNPKAATTHAATPMGPIGLGINGVALFNQYAAGGSPLTGEINSFDQYNGHPQQQGQYHYHVEPLYLTTNKGKDALLGFLLDGFPVYGPVENGKTLTSADLDVYHGHTGTTPDYTGGIYHYHFTADAPYLNGSGFYGTAGTVTQ